MEIDNPPSDEEILSLIRAQAAGMAPEDLINNLSRSYGEVQIIEALQRVFERGKVDFSPDALLVSAGAIAQAA